MPPFGSEPVATGVFEKNGCKIFSLLKLFDCVLWSAAPPRLGGLRNPGIMSGILSPTATACLWLWLKPAPATGFGLLPTELHAQ